MLSRRIKEAIGHDKKHTGIAFKGGFKECPSLFHTNHYYTSFANFAGNPALHGLILAKLNR
ncbi:hypothetical protein D3C86_1945550 [compost metagenome]